MYLTYIVSCSLAIIYPCQQTINCFAQESEFPEKTLFHKITNVFLAHLCQSIVLLNFCDVLSFSSKYTFTSSQIQYKFFYNAYKVL